MSKPKKPLKPTFSNERARLWEHNQFMQHARRQHGTESICPDCYEPATSCIHIRRKQ